MTRKIPARYLAGIFLCLFAASCSTQSVIKEPDTLDLRADFLSIALQQEYKNGSSRLQKWSRQTVFWHSNAAASDIGIITGLLDKISQVTEHRFAQARPDRAALHIDVSADALGILPDTIRLSPKNRRALSLQPCFFLTSAKDWVIQQAYIHISADLTDEQRQHCLSEELVQVMGLFADNARIQDSILRDGSPRNTPSETDWKLLGMLYAPDLKPGMSKEEVEGLLMQRQ